MKKCDLCGITEEDIQIILTGGTVESTRGQLTLAHEGVPLQGDLCLGPIQSYDESQVHFFTVSMVKTNEHSHTYMDTDDFILDEFIDAEQCVPVEVNAHIHDRVE